jgi:protein tyrosine/serine phosphatase
MTLYAQILDNAGDALGIILRHIRDHPTEGFLIYCTGMFHGPFLMLTFALTFCVESAGKDRTGIFAAIILKVRPPTNRLVLALRSSILS